MRLGELSVACAAVVGVVDQRAWDPDKLKGLGIISAGDVYVVTDN